MKCLTTRFGPDLFLIRKFAKVSSSVFRKRARMLRCRILTNGGMLVGSVEFDDCDRRIKSVAHWLILGDPSGTPDVRIRFSQWEHRLRRLTYLPGDEQILGLLPLEASGIPNAGASIDVTCMRLPDSSRSSYECPRGQHLLSYEGASTTISSQRVEE